MVEPPEYDDLILQKLEDIPQRWDRNQKQVVLNLIVQKEDASWISSRIYEDVSRGLISSHIHAKHSEHSVDLAITLTVNVDLTPIIAALSLLLYELKTKTITRYLHRQRKIKRNESNIKKLRSRR